MQSAPLSATPDRWPNVVGLVAICALAYVLCDLLHEFAHALATLMPLGVTAVSISTIGLSSTGSSAVVAVAGPLINFAMALTVLLALMPSLSPATRFFAWLFGSVNLFNATAYLIYSAILGSGDWATVFDAITVPALWRLIAGIAGLGLYAASIFVSLVTLRRLTAAGVVSPSRARSYCVWAYWVGGIVVTAGALFNPISPWFILTSGVATGFGAMLGLLALPALLGEAKPAMASEADELSVGWPWVVAGGTATILFVGVLGPGLQLAR